MKALLLAPLLVLAMVLVQFAVPGKPVYHYGWYNVAILGLLVVGVFWWRGVARRAPSYAGAATLAWLGVSAIAAAGIANGLFAPNDATVISAPGATVAVDDLHGSLIFPLVNPSSDPRDVVVSFRRGGSTLEIPAGATRAAGAFLLRSEPRPVVAVDAADATGAHLTMTQPTGTAFLSPVLAMPAEQTVEGMNLPFDTFAVPAAHRIVRAVLFDARHVAMLHNVTGDGRAAVLFAVDDETGRPLTNAIRLAFDGERVTAGGLDLRPSILSYPAIRVIAIPLPLLTGIGLALLMAALAWSLMAHTAQVGVRRAIE
jgi:hypothetical protein